MSIIKVPWRARFKLVVVDEEDYDKVNTIKWTYFNYGDFVGYNVKTATKKRINRIEERILGPIDYQKNEIIHLNKNGLDNRKANLMIVTKYQAGIHKNQKHITSTANELIFSYNKIISDAGLKQDKLIDYPVCDEQPTIKKPKLKKIEIEGITIPDDLKDYLYYCPVKENRTDYFYIIGHPVILEKLNRRRFQGTKSKALTTQEKFEQIQMQLEEIIGSCPKM